MPKTPPTTLRGWMRTLRGAALIVIALPPHSLLVIFGMLGVTLLATLGLLRYSYVAFRGDVKREPRPPRAPSV